MPPVKATEDIRFGLDFGTTNSSIALANGDGAVEVVRFQHAGGSTESFRSLLYLEKYREGHRTTIASYSGPAGIERYLQADDKGRLMQSLKSFLASRSLQATEVFGRRFTLESLIAKLIRDIRQKAEAQWGIPVKNVTVGRPVRFVGSSGPEDDDYALKRLTAALLEAGFENIRFEYEPVAAATYYESTLNHDELILIGDFGGGTSDFSLLRAGPSFRKSGKAGDRVLGNLGLALAGDAFDAKLIRYLVSPRLGAGTSLQSGNKRLPVPNWVYFKLERWHHLSFLRSRETLHMLESVARQAVEPEKISSLLYLVKHDLGFALHRAVQEVKAALSQGPAGQFRFDDGDVEIDAAVTRAEFESWIAEELSAVEESVDTLLKNTGVERTEVDRVFLTGGSSFVPAVRLIFERRFGAEKITSGQEFTSVAHGLALSRANSTYLE